MRNDIEMGIRAGKFWHNSPKVTKLTGMYSKILLI